MNKEIENYIKKVSLEYLANHEIGKDFEKIFSLYENVQKNAVALIEKSEDCGMIGLKVITVMTFAILKKLSVEKKLADFNQDDWKDVGEIVSKYAILQNESQYVVSIFGMYEKYIRTSADYIVESVSEEKVAEICFLADEIAEKTNLFKEGQIKEVAYIEHCLWISLESMIKLLALSTSKILNEDNENLVYTLSTYAFEYGRLSLYKQEQELVNEFIQSQYQLDCELHEKYDRFIEELTTQSEHFVTLIENAFAPEFRECFLGSIAFAKEIGVPEQELLKSINEIDSFFND